MSISHHRLPLCSSRLSGFRDFTATSSPVRSPRGSYRHSSTFPKCPCHTHTPQNNFSPPGTNVYVILDKQTAFHYQSYRWEITSPKSLIFLRNLFSNTVGSTSRVGTGLIEGSTDKTHNALRFRLVYTAS